MAATSDSTFVRLAHLEEHASWLSWLVPDETKRAQTLANETLRARFVVSRGLRRAVLSDCLKTAPRHLQFLEEPETKPSLQNSQGWDFNITHAGDYVAIAARYGSVGLDLEKIRPVRQMASIVHRYFHPDEAAAWVALEKGTQVEGFFILWAAREAAMKCVGLGLARGLSITWVDSHILHGDEAHATVGDTRFSLRRLKAPAGYVMMVATSERLPAERMEVKN